jgi:hypothetical protein
VSAPEPARRRALACAFAVSYLYRAFAALLLALPIVVALGASGIRSVSRGDARLFEPGGLYLLEVIVSSRALLADALAPTLAVAVVLGLGGLAPELWLLRAMKAGAAPPERGLRRLLALALATWGARLLLGLLTVGLALTARSFVASARDERLPLLAVGGAVALGLLLQALCSIWHDLASMEIAARGSSTTDAILAALERARRSAAALVACYAGTQVLALAVLLAAAAAVTSLDVARGEGWRSASALAVHQLAVLVTLALRAAWLWSTRRAAPPAPQADAFL